MTEWEEMVFQVKKRGKEDGLSCASWYWDSVSPDIDDYMRVLKGIRDSDPVIVDTLPYPRLSGEWAGDMTASELLEDILGSDDELDPDDVSVLLDAYSAQFTHWSQQQIWSDCVEKIIDYIDENYLSPIEDYSDAIKTIMTEAEVMHVSETQLRLLLFKEKVEGLRAHLAMFLENCNRGIGNATSFV